MRDSMVFSPDGNTLAGYADGTIYLWNVHRGELQKTLTVGSEEIKSMVFSPDGSTLAFISAVPGVFDPFDYFIDVWDLRTGRRKFNHLNADCLLGFSPDGEMLAGRRRDFYGSTVSLWEANTGSCKFTFTAPYPTTPPDSYTDTPDLGSATSLAFSPVGSTLAAYNRRVNKIQFWDYHIRNCKSTFTGIDRITSLVFSPDGSTLAAGCEDRTVLLWDVDGDNNKSVLKEKDTKFQNRASQIQQFCEERGIKTLCHFTRIKYLRSILHEGLLDHQSLLKRHGQQFVPNDKQRIDGHKEAICLSISFPNSPLFSKFSWSDDKKQPDYSGWVVLLLDAKVLWELDCAFCQTNASSGAVIPLLLDEQIDKQKIPKALKDIFAEDYYDSKREIWIRRQDLQIPEHYTTDPQAEVLVFDPISAKYIKEVHFYAETARKQWLSRNSSTHSQTFSSNRDYFDGRRDSAFWKKETP